MQVPICPMQAESARCIELPRKVEKPEVQGLEGRFSGLLRKFRDLFLAPEKRPEKIS